MLFHGVLYSLVISLIVKTLSTKLYRKEKKLSIDSYLFIKSNWLAPLRYLICFNGSNVLNNSTNIVMLELT